MKFQFCSIGKSNEATVKDGVNDFTLRITKYFPVQWNIVAPLKNAGAYSEQELKKREGIQILSMLTKDDYLVALDNKGKQMSSAKLAEFIQLRANESTRQMIFLIGGAYGLDEPVLQRANLLWSLSELTFPHQLVRLILAEQVYRACTIIRNEKYHHG